MRYAYALSENQLTVTTFRARAQRTSVNKNYHKVKKTNKTTKVRRRPTELDQELSWSLGWKRTLVSKYIFKSPPGLKLKIDSRDLPNMRRIISLSTIKIIDLQPPSQSPTKSPLLPRSAVKTTRSNWELRTLFLHQVSLLKNGRVLLKKYDETYDIFLQTYWMVRIEQCLWMSKWNAGGKWRIEIKQ